METTVNTPFGPIIVNHPDDATQAEILRFAEIASTQREQRRQAIAAENPAEFDPSSEAFQEQFGPVSGSRTRRFFEGAGKAAVDLGRGIRQTSVEGADLIPGVDLTDTADRLREEQSLVRERDAPLLGTGSAITGNVLSNIGMTLLASRLGARGAGAANLPRLQSGLNTIANPLTFRGAAATGALQGALAPVTDEESRGVNALLGAASGLAGQGISRGLGRFAQPVSRNLSESQDDAVSLLLREGVDLDVGQRTGSVAAASIRRALQDNPLTTGGQVAFAGRQQRQFTRAVLRTIGADSDEATPAVLNAARQRVGNAIDEAASANPAFFDTDMASGIRQILETAPDVGVDDTVLNALNRNIQRITQAAARNDGFIPGPVFSSVRSNLSKLSMKTPVARELNDVLVNALERSGGDPEQLALAIAQFRNIRIIEDSLEKGAERVVSPLRLSNVVATQRNRALSQRGLGHQASVALSNLAQAGSTVFREGVGNSGTASRSFGTMGLALLAGAGEDLGAARASRFVGIPLATQRVVNSQNQFLAEGLQNPIIRDLIQSDAINIAANQGAIQAGLIGAR